MIRLATVLLTSLLSLPAVAAIVCEGASRLGNKVTTTIDGSTVTVVVTKDSDTLLTETFQNVSDTWDGHMTGLMTAPGLSVKYEDQYGCIRNVVVTTNVRGGGIGYIEQISSRVCRGGSTSDDLCLQRRRR
jgi:hypothetical protein